MLSAYEKRLLREAKARGELPSYKVGESLLRKPVVVIVDRAKPIDPQYANRVRRIKFGSAALRDFPRIASIWASDYAECTEGND